MKVVLIHTDFKLYWIDRIRWFKEYCEQHKMELTVLEIANNSVVYHFDTTTATDLSWWKCLYTNRSIDEIPQRELSKTIYNKLTEIDPDVIVSGPFAFPSGAVSLRWANQHKKRIIIFDDVKKKNVKRNFFTDYIKRTFYQRVDGYFAPSQSYYQDLKFWGFEKENIFIGYNCINNNLFKRKTADELDSYRFEAFSYEKDTNYVLCVARFVPKKNHENLVRAWQKFLSNYTGSKTWKLLLAGEGPLKVNVEKLIKDKGIQNVIMLGSVSQSLLPYYYSISSALIIPSYHETWGLVVNEAMAAGLPVLVSDQCNACDDLVMDGENGYVFSPFQIESIAKAFIRLSDTSELNALGRKSLEIISGYNLDFFCTNLMAAIQYVMKKPVKKKKLISSFILNFWHGQYNLRGFNEI